MSAAAIKKSPSALGTALNNWYSSVGTAVNTHAASAS
jgi:hypothetical protein